MLTQPDRPAGRGRKLHASPVKVFAIAHDIAVSQPASLKDPDIVAQLTALEPDIMVVAAYGLLLPQAVLDVPRLGCVNVHASLLPRWRGAAPIQQAILNGDPKTGVCLMQMETGLDTGPVFACVETPIGPTETAGQLRDRLARLGAELLVARLPGIIAGDMAPLPQDDGEATYAGKIQNEDAAIDWGAPAQEIARKIRAYTPDPGAFFLLGEERIKCWRASVLNGRKGPEGVVQAAGKEGIDVACGEGVLRIEEVQRPGRNRIRATQLAAQTELAGKRLG